MNINEIFEKHDNEYLKFERVQNKLSSRPDLHAFRLLDSLVPGQRDMVSSAEHDEIWLGINPGELAKVATEEQIVELIRCGVRMDDTIEAFVMFV